MRVMSLLLLAGLLSAAGLILWRSPWSYAAQDRLQPAATASAQHPAGTDELGRDRMVRTAAALLLGAAGSIAASALASICAVGLAVAAAFAAPWIGRALLYLCDLFLTLPWIFLLMMVRSALPFNLAPLQSALVTFSLLGILGVPAFLRLHYTRARALRQADWMLHGRASGLKTSQIAVRLIPHLRPMLLTQFVLYVPACLIAEANLGTLGLGVGEPLASWGSMLQSLHNAAFLNTSRLIYIPVALLVLVLTCLELLIFDEGDALR